MGTIKLINLSNETSETNIDNININLNDVEETHIKPISFETRKNKSDNVVIEMEDVSLRKYNEKHYFMSDGTRRAEIYNEPVHYFVSNLN